MYFKRILVSVLATFSLFFSLPHVSAQTSGGSGLTISPTRSELTINKGKADFIQVTLKNTSGVDIVAKAEVNDFTADNVTGEPKISVDKKKVSQTSIAKFLVGVTDITLAKDETKKFDIPVQIPENTTSGAYYGVIRYTAVSQTKQETKGRQVALNASLGLIVLIQVPGNITEQVQAQKIAVSRNDSNGSFFIAPPTRANVTLKNTGNGFTKPFGRVTITKGKKEVFSYEMNSAIPKSNILPGSIRTFSDEIKNVSSLGRYTISANVSYGTGGDILTLKTSFWVLPLWFMIMLLVLIVLIIGAGLFMFKRVGRRPFKRRR